MTGKRLFVKMPRKGLIGGNKGAVLLDRRGQINGVINCDFCHLGASLWCWNNAAGGAKHRGSYLPGPTTRRTDFRDGAYGRSAWLGEAFFAGYEGSKCSA